MEREEWKEKVLWCVRQGRVHPARPRMQESLYLVEAIQGAFRRRRRSPRGRCHPVLPRRHDGVRPGRAGPAPYRVLRAEGPREAPLVPHGHRGVRQVRGEEKRCRMLI